MQNIMYTNEFLKNLEKIIKAEDIELLSKIKEALEVISQNNSEKIKLENIKTNENGDVFQEIIETKKEKYSLFWINNKKKEEQKIIVCLTKNT